MLARLRAAGYPSVVVVDLRNDDMGLDVVRVVVPGLEGYIGFDCYSPGPRARARAGAAGPGGPCGSGGPVPPWRVPPWRVPP